MFKMSNKNFICSDLHFFHRNIIKFCNRPYNVEDVRNRDFHNEEILRMNEDILKEFDKLPEDCTIWNNGDVFFAGESSKKDLIACYDELKSIVQRMKGPTGKRILRLVLGNHDKLHRENEWIVPFYMSLGFDFVYDSPVIIEDSFILSHEPIYISPANNFKNLYGHTHDIDIEEDYFCWDYTNIALQKRPDAEGAEEPVLRWPEKKVDLDKYFNVCWDKHHKILDLNAIIKSFN